MEIQVRINSEGALRNQRHAFTDRFTLVSELLQNARDILEVGERVICRVRARKVDEEIRFSMDGVKKLSQASIGTHETLLVRISADAPLERIASVARGLQKSPTENPLGEIHIEIPVEGKVVTIALEGRYPVDFGAMSAFKSVPGVDQVRPAAA